jgi:hypothetical protein
MADIRLFAKHFERFSWVSENVGERELIGSGVFKGFTDVKGFASDVEVLTSVGWLGFADVKNVLLGERELFDRMVVEYNHFVAVNGSGEGFPFDDFVYVPLLVASVAPYDFVVPVEGKVSDGVSEGGRVVFVQPSGFSEWVYGRSLVEVKLRGLDFSGSMYADVVAKRRWREGYGFVSLNDVYNNRYGGYFYLMLNRFNVDVGGGFVPQLGEVLNGFTPHMVVGSDVFVSGRGAEVVPVKNTSLVKRFNDRVFNVSVEPYHSVIVRKGRERRVDGSLSVRPLLGKPVVVGDSVDKNVLLSVSGRRK